MHRMKFFMSSAAEEPPAGDATVDHPGRGGRADGVDPKPAADRLIAGPHRAVENLCTCTTARSEALSDITMDFPRNQVTALIGPSGCGKSTLPALPQPHERPDRRRPHHGQRSCFDGQDIIDPAARRDRAAPAGGHGVPEAHALPQVDLRERGLRAADRRRPRPARAGRGRREEPAAGRPCGTKSRTGCTNRPWAFPAASTSGCASPGPSPSTRKSSSWTSPARRWTRAPPPASRT